MTRLKKDRVYDELRRRIETGEYVPQLRLPNELELARECGVSFITLRSALARLSEDGLIERLPGRGTFVRKLNSPEPKKLLMALSRLRPEKCPLENDFFNRELISGVLTQSYIAGFTVDIRSQSQIASGIEDALAGLYDAVIFDRPDSPECQALLGRLQEKGVPTVVTLRRNAGFPSVVLSSSDGMFRMVRYLFGIGHRHIALIDRDATPIDRERINAFQHELRIAGVANPQRHCILNKECSTAEKIAEGMKAFPFSAVILGCSRRKVFQEFITAFPHKNYSVIQWGVNGEPDSYSVFSEARPETGCEAVKLVQRMLAGKAVPEITEVTGELMIRTRCAAPVELLDAINSK